MSDTSPPAFPSECANGMTLRQYAAIHAMQGLLANTNETRSPENLASSSVCFADALLKVLETK